MPPTGHFLHAVPNLSVFLGLVVFTTVVSALACGPPAQPGTTLEKAPANTEISTLGGPESTIEARERQSVAALPTPRSNVTTRAPTSTPDLESTVQAMVSEALTKLPAPTPLYWPTLEDFKSIAYITIDKAFEGQGFGSGNFYRDRVDEDHGQYAAVYVAKECLANRELSFDSFRSFIDQTYLRVQSADGVPVLNVTARAVIAELLLSNALEESGLALASDGCTGRFFYPETPTKARLAIDLVKATGVKAKLNPFAAAGFDPVFARGAYRWFDPATAKGKPFLPWLCEGEWWGSELCRVQEK